MSCPLWSALQQSRYSTTPEIDMHYKQIVFIIAAVGCILCLTNTSAVAQRTDNCAYWEQKADPRVTYAGKSTFNEKEPRAIMEGAYSQDNTSGISVELKSSNTTISKKGSFNFSLNIINNTQKNVYLVVEDEVRKSYNPTTRELGIGIDKQTSNFHYLEFPKLRKIKPKGKTTLNLLLPVSAWKVVEAGEWKIIASIGVLEEKKLKSKLKDLGFSLKDKIQMTVSDFLELQTVFYSNYIPVNILE